MTSPRSDGSASPASDFATSLLAEFVAAGVRHVVLSPGSRSQALALAAAALERQGALSLHVRIDERVGGFTALGLAAETGTPVLVVVTSGTAVANLHPAVLEARHSGAPLVLLTADRPPELRGIGANQTTDQLGVFGSAVVASRDFPAPPDAPPATEVVQWALAEAASGPVQLNLAFREPLSAVVPTPEVAPAPAPAPDDAAPVLLEPASGTVVIAGTGAGPAAEELAHALGAPLLAEVASGARFGPNLVAAYREVLAEFGGEVRRAIVFGHPTLSREVPALLGRADVEVIVVRSPGVDDYNPGHRVARFVDALAYEGEPEPRGWAGRWVAASRALLADDTRAVGADESATNSDFRRAELARVRARVDRRALVQAVWAATWPHDRLVLGASRLIREADRVVPGKKLRVHANRGLAGIDGTIATATGIALASQTDASRPGVTRVLLGDLAALHDVGALLAAPGEKRPRMQVIVGNDRGGTIFDGLEVAATAPAEDFERVLLTPQQVSFAALAEAYGWQYRLVQNRGDLEQALSPTAAPTLIEVPLER
ncbi:2-succinyl-5-enolpyruvyl-6-hydroxy-3-cyclohexene-1-carboxylic-acid synthase [Desertivibrio insolitus]|uniref:2-succinyl-5-enolpyruvyl-6-hydroxy-3- cyclohexene-1-carboxylic-acid synthase n=1 Tax=Herbiconiux sp. SYSU D00978 TaxID=2812562 RepID=UPI001A958FBD|nr:2-succinyl-5-enolpyruvyl-6-hydroxy-3-cyclohexene-1-carboxylic-acid synthase [Herbiconiux sp. SYSU D00978]